jgi:hypothetical protein
MNTPDPRTSLLKRLGLAWCSCLFLIALFAPRQAEAQGSSAPTDLTLTPSSIEESKAAGAGALAATSPDEVPAGLEKSDWASIRAAHTAWEHSFQAVKGGAWQAQNKGQQWSTKFDGRGFTAKPQGADWQWGLELRSYGFGKKQTAVGGQPAVKAEGQRLSYQWDSDVQEWFVNDQRGLEHGFTVARRPQGAAADAGLDMVLGTRGTLKASVAAAERLPNSLLTAWLMSIHRWRRPAIRWCRYAQTRASTTSFMNQPGTKPSPKLKALVNWANEISEVMELSNIQMMSGMSKNIKKPLMR